MEVLVGKPINGRFNGDTMGYSWNLMDILVLEWGYDLDQSLWPLFRHRNDGKGNHPQMAQHFNYFKVMNQHNSAS